MALALIPPEFEPGRAAEESIIEGIASSSESGETLPREAVEKALRDSQIGSPFFKDIHTDRAKVQLPEFVTRTKKGTCNVINSCNSK